MKSLLLCNIVSSTFSTMAMLPLCLLTSKSKSILCLTKNSLALLLGVRSAAGDGVAGLLSGGLLALCNNLSAPYSAG